MTLNIEVVGETGSVRQLADSLRQLGAGVEDTATVWHRARGTAEGVWEGQASDSFQQLAGRTGKDGDELARLHTGAADALTVFADELDTVKARMAQAATVAREGQLVVLAGSIICEPTSIDQQPGTQLGGAPLTQGANQARTPEQYDAAQALNAKKQAAFAEAQATVHQARQTEKAAHEKLIAALSRNTKDLSRISQAGAWSQAAESATHPAAAGLAKAAVALDQQATGATRAMFEKAMTGGPASVSAAWAALSTAQKGDLISDHPKLVGNTNGVPVVARDQANRSILESQRQAITEKLNNARKKLRENFQREGHSDTALGHEIKELTEARAGIDTLQAKLGNSAEQSDYYLLGLNSTANDRGQAIIAHGNPDQANNTMTLAPGTFSDLGDATDYVCENDKILQRANELSAEGTKNSAVTWADYESPGRLLPNAGFAGYAENGSPGLSEFQEGLRVTHEGDAPSNNTLVGHSYGTTLVGDASQNGGSHADNLVFLGSPGTGTDHANNLDVPNDHVWAGKAGEDTIDSTPSKNIARWPSTIFGTADYTRYGLDPTDPAFGGQILPSSPNGVHGDYWSQPQSREAMARIMTGTQGGGPQ